MTATLTDDALEFSSNCGWQSIEKALRVACQSKTNWEWMSVNEVSAAVNEFFLWVCGGFGTEHYLICGCSSITIWAPDELLQKAVCCGRISSFC